MKKNNKKALMAMIGAALAFGGMTPQASSTTLSNEKSDIPTHTRYADENKLANYVVQHRKRTPIGTIVNQAGRPFWSVVPQKRRKHTNLRHKSHEAKIKRRKARNKRR